MAEPEQITLTTLAALKPAAPAEIRDMPMVRAGFGDLQSFELMQRAAKLLASSTLVPKEYQGNLPNCVIALNMAQRIGADPLQVMQSLYIVHGRPSWSAQFLVACFNTCGRFSALRYKWQGTQGNDDWSCQAYATEKATGDVIDGPVITIALAKKEGWYQKSGSKWQSIPQLMLMYRAAAWLVRTHAPEISMGLQTAEELHDVFQATPNADGSYGVTIDSLREAQEIVDTATGEVTDAEPTPQEIPGATPDWLDAIRTAGTVKALDSIWKNIPKASQSIDVEAAYHDRKEALEQKL